MSRMTITLSDQERQALSAMAAADQRYPKQQILHLLHEAARARGLLVPPGTAADAPPPDGPAHYPEERLVALPC